MHRPVEHDVDPDRIEEVDVIGDQDGGPVQKRDDHLVQRLKVEQPEQPRAYEY